MVDREGWRGPALGGLAIRIELRRGCRRKISLAGPAAPRRRLHTDSGGSGGWHVVDWSGSRWGAGAESEDRRGEEKRRGTGPEEHAVAARGGGPARPGVGCDLSRTVPER